MKITPYLAFNGNCREAFEFYANCLEGRIESIFTFGESPMRDEVGSDWRDRIMHATLVAEGALLMGSDGPPERHETPAGFMVALEIDDIDKAQRIFDAFAEGGTVSMPFEEVFWVERFGMVTDRFGTPWAINGGKSKFG